MQFFKVASLILYINYANSLPLNPLSKTKCGNGNQDVNYEGIGCKSVTSTATFRPGCVVNGKYYAPGQDIDSSIDQSNSMCYGRYCDLNNQIIYRNRSCVTTTAESTLPPTTPTEATVKLGCVVEGKFYDRGQTIASSYDQTDDWCYGTYCNDNGKVIAWDTFDCKKSSFQITTTSTTVTFIPETQRSGCYLNERFYESGEEIDSGNDGDQWCFGRVCQHGGEIISWDNFNCFPTTTKETTKSDFYKEEQ